MELQLGQLLVVLKDHETGQQTAIAAPDLESVFDEVERLLGAGRAVWRKFHTRRPKPPKRKQ